VLIKAYLNFTYIKNLYLIIFLNLKIILTFIIIINFVIIKFGLCKYELFGLNKKMFLRNDLSTVAFLFAYFFLHTCTIWNACSFMVYSNWILKRLKHSLFVHYRDLQALVHEQETRNLTLPSAAPRAVLNFLFIVRELVLVNPDNALQECCNP
jgi:hypothetical protein